MSLQQQHIKQLSFIVIGRNEGKHIEKCIRSVETTVIRAGIRDYEVLYVDSKSSDDSLEKVLAFKAHLPLRVFSITGDCNAAIARNIGAAESTGEILYFIDGDMEIDPDFLQHAINEKGELVYDCLTGHLDDVCYDMEGNFIGRYPRTYTNNIPGTEKILSVNGGIFLVKRAAWEKVGGMRNKYRRSQDLDLTLRLAEKGIKTVQLPYLVTLHHTVDYKDQKRMWDMLLTGTDKFPALLFRDHIFNQYAVKRTIRSQYTAFLLAVCLVSMFVSFTLLNYLLLIYAVALFARVYLTTRKAKKSKAVVIYFIERLLVQVARDFYFLAALLFFFPADKKAVYEECNQK